MAAEPSTPPTAGASPPSPLSSVIGKYTSSEKGLFGREPLTAFGTFKMYLGYVLVIPVRVALLIPFWIVTLSLLVLCLVGSDEGGPKGCRKALFEAVVFIWMRGTLFLFGYYYISVEGKKEVPDGDQSYVVIGNHVGWMEVSACVRRAGRFRISTG